MSENLDKTVKIETVKIIAINKKYKEKPYFMCMPYDNKLNKCVNGLEDISPLMISKMELVPKEEDTFPIQNNMEFKLEKNDKGNYLLTRDYALYKLALVDPNIANSRAEATNKHLFYIENFEKEAEQIVSVSKAKAQAGGKVAELVSLKDMYDVLFYMGKNPSSLSQTRAEGELYKLVEERPKDVLEYFNKIEHSRKIVFVKKCLSYGFLKKNSNGYIQYEDNTLGANDDEAASFLWDEKHSSIYEPLKDMVDKIEKVK